MKAEFRGFYRPADTEFKEIWNSCSFFVDANVLLYAYRLQDDAREDLINTFENIKDRLWIPYQAALEFQRNRLNVISEQKTRFEEVKSFIENIVPSISKMEEKLQLRKRHSKIDLTKLSEDIRAPIDQFLKQLKDLNENQLNVQHHDILRDKIDKIFFQRVGSAPTQQWIDKIAAEGAYRFDRKTPPGYSDKVKKSSTDYQYGGVHYPAKYGDLFLWKQIIEKTKELNNPIVIFVTEDSKEDWWWTVDSQGEKTIGPRPELIDEIMREGNANFFYMYNLTQFLQYSRRYLNFGISTRTIKQVKEVAIASHVDSSLQSKIRYLEQATMNWLKHKFPNCNISQNKTFPDFSVYDPILQAEYAVELFAIGASSYSAETRIRVAINKFQSTGRYAHLFIKLISIENEDTDVIKRKSQSIAKRLQSVPKNISIDFSSICSSTNDGDQKELLQYEYSLSDLL